MKTARMMRAVTVVGGIALVLLTGGRLSAQTPAAGAGNLLGAQKVLERVAQATATNAASPANPAAKAREVLQADVKGFKVNRTSLSPDEAASAWLALFDRFWALAPGSDSDRFMFGRSGDSGPLSVQAVIGALPPPAAWEALSARIEKRTAKGKDDQIREAALRLLADYLMGSTVKLQQDLNTLEAQAKSLDRYQRESAMEMVRALRMDCQRRLQDGTPESTVREFEKTLEIQKSARQRNVQLKVPDLVALAGEKRAEALIIKAMEIPGAQINIRCGKDTLALARRVCLDRAGKLLEPQWDLVGGPDAVELYEKLDKKFPAKDSAAAENAGSPFVEHEYESNRNDSGRATAAWHYLLGLLARDRVQDAVAFITSRKNAGGDEWMSLGSHQWGRAEDLVPPARLFDFCERLLKAKTDFPLWDPYIGLALQMSRTNEMIQLLTAEASAPGLTFDQQVKASEHLASGYLAADRVNDAVAEFRRILQRDSAGQSPAVQRAFENRRMKLGLRLANLGRLLKQPEWIAEGIQAAETALAGSRALSGRELEYRSEESLDDICDLLVKEHQYARAESNLVDSITAKLKARSVRSSNYGTPDALETELTQLAGIYYAAGRYSDILALLEQAPWWGVKDLALLHNNRCSEGPPLAVMAAEALHAAGRSAQAVEILKAHINENPIEDASYKLLVRLGPTDLVAWLDMLYQRDRFEERPLIWKAALLLKDGRLDDAEKVAREALRVDPTDGEARAGNRVKGYAVLGDILEAKGKKDDAAFFRKVVESVRIAEQGDELTGVGLITRSLALYEQAQVFFADAYCVQWRLARRLDALGNTAEAEKHYRIAFERMPEQFGQVASFCFGCEGAFESKHSRSVAETVLLSLEKNGPKRPQVYYLLGQLREAQNRQPEAFALYKQAVGMDPDYLDAWKKIHEIADGLFLPQSERDGIRLQMLRMDPLQRHTYGDINEISDLKALWRAVETAQALNIKPALSLLPLTASAGRLRELKKGLVEDEEDWRYYRYQGYGSAMEPGAAVAGNRVIEQLVRIMELGASASMQVFEE